MSYAATVLEALSILGKDWKIKVSNDRFISTLIQKFNLPPLAAKLLANLELPLEEIEHFLAPKLKNLLPDPFHLKDMDKAALRCVEALENNERICIFADYDVDGATSAALISNFLHDLGFHNTFIYVPDRIKEGYGPTAGAMNIIKDQGAKVVITVDCGAAAFSALDEAHKVGLDVIVIDHHLGSEMLPKAVAIVNPNRVDEDSKYTYLAAVGVSYLFITAVYITLKQKNLHEKYALPNLLQYLDLVALGTVCDVMKLQGLNRAFVIQGLKILAQTNNVGLKALFKTANISEAFSIYHLGFIIGPRINAGGRVGRSILGSHLLTCKDIERAEQFALELENYNVERKLLENNLLEEALAQAAIQEDYPIIIIYGDGWHPGVIGIIAGKVKEAFHKPVAVIGFDGDTGKASSRSVIGVDLGKHIIEAKSIGLLIEGGGHAMAAGFTIHKSKLEDFRNFLHQNITYSPPTTFYYDIELMALSLDTAKEILLLAPFGQGNPEPIIRVKNLSVLSAKEVGTGHISCLLRHNNSKVPAFKAFMYNPPICMQELLYSKNNINFDVIGRISISKWQNKENLQLTIMDCIVN